MATPIHKPEPLSRRKRFLFRLIICTFFIVSFLFLAEIILRWKGLGPWDVRRPDITWTPAGRYHSSHPTLGYITNPGEFRFTYTLPGGYTFKTTHLRNGLRITHSLSTYSGTSKKEIWIFGCSFTQGWSLNDEETYPWLLQAKLQDYEVVNFGVDGYSTVQSLLQFREALTSGHRPALVIVSYGHFHDQRNTLTRAWIKARLTAGAGYAYGSVNLPYATLSRDNQLEILYRPLEYHQSPLLGYSALVNLLDDTYNKHLENAYHSLKVSQALIDEFSNLCMRNGIEFVLAGILSDPDTAANLEHCDKEGIKTVDISVDLSRKENNNLPYDGHPSAIANKQYAQKLESFLCGKLIDMHLCPR